MEKICDLQIDKTEKKILTICYEKALTIPEVSAKLNIGYSTASQKLHILIARNFMRKISTLSGSKRFKTNIEILEV